MGIDRRRGARTVLLLAGAMAGTGDAVFKSAFAQAELPASAPRAPAQIIADVETELIRVEAVVIDRNGRAVTGLTVEDFLVLEDGRPQTITNFQAGVGPGPADASGDEAGAPPAAPLGTRHIVLAIDDLHMSPHSISGCKDTLKRFLAEKVSEEDEVALVTTSGNLGLFQAFTKERVALRRAIDRLAYMERRGNAGGRAEMSEYEAEAIDRNDPDALRLALGEIEQREALVASSQMGAVVNPRWLLEARGMASGILAQALQTTNRTLEALEKVVRGLGSVPGRKVLVLLSDGFVIGHGSQDPRANDMRRIFDASARAGVTVYALDSGGLDATPSGGGVDAAARVRTSPAAIDGYRRAADLVQRANLSTLAEGTGGFLVHGNNDLLAGLGQILRDSDASYLLAYPPSHRDYEGRYHSIQVRVPKRPDLEVRTRKGYFASRKDRRSVAARTTGSETLREAEMRGALASLVPLDGVPLRMSVDFLFLPPDGPQVVVKARVDLNGLPVRMEGERRRAEVELLGVVYDETGAVAGKVEGDRIDMSLTPATYQQMLEEGLRYEKSVALGPGVYQVRLVARESLSGRLGSAYAWIEIPDVNQGALTLSHVFVYAEVDKARTGVTPRTVVENADNLRDAQILRRFAQGGKLYYRLYVYNPARDQQGATDVVVQAQVWSGGKLQGVSPIEPVAFEEKGPAPKALAGLISLEGLLAGEHELRVVVKDRKANAHALRRLTFTVG